MFIFLVILLNASKAVSTTATTFYTKGAANEIFKELKTQHRVLRKIIFAAGLADISFARETPCFIQVPICYSECRVDVRERNDNFSRKIGHNSPRHLSS
jgi:hypothetical protein